jgi:hypothetical protein
MAGRGRDARRKMSLNAMTSYAALTQQVVRSSNQPLTFAEILARVAQLRPITTRSPQATIRSAMGQGSQIVNVGEGRYGWYPRFLQGSRVRVELKTEDLKVKRIVFGNDVRDLLWPAFFGNQTIRDHDPINLALPNGKETLLPLDFFGSGVWGTTGTPELWHWLKQEGREGGDFLLLEAIDAEQRQYRLFLDADPDPAVLEKRTQEVEAVAREVLWKRRQMPKHLFLSGCYRHPIPPAPLERFWTRVNNQVQLVAIARQELKQKKAKDPQEIYRLRITLGVEPHLVWRELQVSDDTTLAELHWILQCSFSWTNSHLHQFQIAEETYSDPRFGLDEPDFPVRDERRRTLRQVVRSKEREFGYEYDFGDGWRHRIEVTEILPADKTQISPVCLGGERAGPPEDCGGFGGYANLLYVLSHPKANEYEETREWVGEGYEPERCDLAAINWQLRML